MSGAEKTATTFAFSIICFNLLIIFGIKIPSTPTALPPNLATMIGIMIFGSLLILLIIPYNKYSKRVYISLTIRMLCLFVIVFIIYISYYIIVIAGAMYSGSLCKNYL